MIDTERQLGELIAKYSPLLHSMIRRNVTTDYHDGWDAYQDICLHLWKYIPRGFDIDKGANLGAYFRKSLFNEVMRYRRRSKLRRLLPEVYRGYFTDRLFGIVYDQDSSCEEFLLQRASAPVMKEVLSMYLYGYTPTEIAKSLQISRSSVYNYLNYFIKILQE